MNIELKPMKLIFALDRDNNTWSKTVTDLKGNVIYQQKGLKMMDEFLNKQYFDDWEEQMRNGPWWNIVEVERFL